MELLLPLMLLLCKIRVHGFQYQCFHQVCGQSIETNFEFYLKRNGNCTICRDYCNQDLKCSAFECGTVHCLGWKNQKCTSVEEMSLVTGDALRTCVKKEEKFVGPKHRQTKCSSTEKDITPFPDRLSKTDKSKFIRISGRYIATYHEYDFSIGKRFNVGSVRSSNPIPSSCNIYYFEMTVLNAGEDGAIGIGLTGKGSRLNAMPGWPIDTVGYHGDNGLVYYNYNLNKKAMEYGPIFGKGDVVGCGIDFDSNTVFFTRKGISFGIAKTNLAKQPWYPTIGLHSSNEQVKINFGQEKFVFNVSKYAGCRTNKDSNSPSKNLPCVFPFNFQKDDNFKCVWDEKGPWCSTKVDKYAFHKGGGGHWGYCNSDCPVYDKSKGLEPQTQHDMDAIQLPPHSNDNVLNNSNEVHVMGKKGMRGVIVKKDEDMKVHVPTIGNKTEDENLKQRSSVNVLMIGISLIVFVASFSLLIFIYKRSKQQTQSVENRPSFKRMTSISFRGKAYIKDLLYGQVDRLSSKKDIKSQAAFLPYNTKREIPKSMFTISEEVGSGNFGTVSKSEIIGLYHPNSKTVAAVKSINSAATDNDLMDLLHEIKIMSYVQPHINLVSMIGSCKCDLEINGDLWLLIEFCQYGDLKNFLIKNEAAIINGNFNDPINSRCLIKWAYDVAKGMNYLSENRIMHGDLAARNVLLDENPLQQGSPVAKVADFGLSKKFYDNVNYTKRERLYVPWKWMAFEFLTKGFFTLRSDVWSFAVVVWEILSFGRIPYGHQEYIDVVKQIEQGFRLPCPDNIKHATNWSPEVLYDELAKLCFIADPDDRATFSDVVQVIEKHLSTTEMSQFERMDEEYQVTRTNNYLKLGQSEEI